MKNFKEATLNDISKEDSESVYVLNNAANHRRMGAGIILLSVALPNEDAQKVIIPMTWAPFDVSSQVPKSALIASTQFRAAVNSKAIILIKTKDAEEILQEDEDTRAEFDRANQDLMGNNNFGLDEVEEGESESVKKRMQETYKKLSDKLKIKREESAAPSEDLLDEGIDNKVIEIIGRTDISEQDMYSLIQLHDKFYKLSSQDQNYILNNCAFDKIKSYVTNKMAR